MIDTLPDSPNSPSPATDLDALAVFKAEAWPLLGSLLRVARMLTSDEHRAEDLVQETMMRGFRHISSFESGTNMKAWLMTILRRTHIDLHRRESRSIEASSLDAFTAEPVFPGPQSVDDANAWSEPDALLERFDDETIESEMRALPETMRWVLLLVDVEQMSIKEAAAALDIAPGTIKSRASRARALLRERLLPLASKRGWLPLEERGSRHAT